MDEKNRQKLEHTKHLLECVVHTSEAERSHDEIRSLVADALRDKHNPGKEYGGPWPRDIFDSDVVYEWDGKLYRTPYLVDDTSGETQVKLGTPVEVKVAYVPVAEVGTDEVETESIFLNEKAVHNDGTVELKLIDPGWGSSGYYSEDVLKRDANIFSKGTLQFWNHQTDSEEAERPEGDLNDLAAVLLTDGVYQEDGWDGPGVYAQAKAFSPYKDVLEEVAPYIGVSIRAYGKGTFGEAEGREGRIIEELSAVKSVDFVTAAGRGGKVRELVEAARKNPVKETLPTPTQEDSMKLEEAQTKITEAEAARDAAIAERDAEKAANEKLREGEILREAKSKAETTIKEASKDSDLPDITQARLVKEVSQNPPTTEDGKLDEAKLKERAEAAVKEAAAEIAAITGAGNPENNGDTAVGEADKTALIEKWQKAGYSEDQAKAIVG